MCWHKLGEVENEYTTEKPVLSAIFMPEIFTIRRNLAKLWQKISLHCFFLRHGVEWVPCPLYFCDSLTHFTNVYHTLNTCSDAFVKLCICAPRCVCCAFLRSYYCFWINWLWSWLCCSCRWWYWWWLENVVVCCLLGIYCVLISDQKTSVTVEVQTWLFFLHGIAFLTVVIGMLLQSPEA